MSDYEKIVVDGPIPTTEVDPSTNDKNRGVRMFRVPGSGSGNGKHLGGPTTSLYYVEGVHSPKEVIRRWLEVNDRALGSSNSWAVFQKVVHNYDDMWTEAAADILGPFEHLEDRDTHKGGPGEKECPVCGETVTTFLRYHLPCNNE